LRTGVPFVHSQQPPPPPPQQQLQDQVTTGREVLRSSHPQGPTAGRVPAAASGLTPPSLSLSDGTVRVHRQVYCAPVPCGGLSSTSQCSIATPLSPTMQVERRAATTLVSTNRPSAVGSSSQQRPASFTAASGPARKGRQLSPDAARDGAPCVPAFMKMTLTQHSFATTPSASLISPSSHMESSRHSFLSPSLASVSLSQQSTK
jgi:hypothetical protein